jgi:hypothetical protein
MENGHTLAFRGISSEALYHFVLLYEKVKDNFGHFFPFVSKFMVGQTEV